MTGMGDGSDELCEAQMSTRHSPPMSDWLAILGPRGDGMIALKLLKTRLRRIRILSNGRAKGLRRGEGKRFGCKRGKVRK